MKSLLALFVLVPAAWCQDKPALKARELFYAPAADAAKPPSPVAGKSTTPKAAPKPKQTAPVPLKAEETHTVAATIPLGLRYAMLKRDASGNYVEVDPDTTFRSGDRIRIKVDANTSGYLYVVTQGSSGNWTLLFPSKEVAGGSNRVEKGDSRQIPAGDRGQFVFDEQAGAEKLFIVLARQPEPDLDKLIYAVGGSKNEAAPDHTLLAQASLHDDVVSRLRQMSSRDLVFEKVDSTDDKGHIENAAYVVNPSKAPDARLVADVVLKHK